MTHQGDRLESGIGSSQSAEKILKTVTQDLESLHQTLVTQLSKEVAQLQADKARLAADVGKLQAEYQTLTAHQFNALSQQQVAQQQLWAKQLAQVLANHLQAIMLQRLDQLASNPQLMKNPAGTVGSPGLPYTNSGQSENAHHLLASLDTTFSATFKTLQQELNSYQSSFSQQLNRMHTLEQQGEAVLEALVNRLREQLQSEMARKPSVESSFSQENGYSPYTQPTGNSSVTLPSTKAKPIPLEFPAAPLSLPKEPTSPVKPAMSQVRLGLILVLVSTMALSFHNVVVRIIGSKSTILGFLQMGGFIQLGLGNSLLILWLRMLIVLPLMVPVAMFLYPAVWKDIKKFVTSHDRRTQLSVVGSGAFLFLSQILIYIAIGQIGPGAAVTILFMYPVITVPLAWLLFRDRPSKLRWVVMAVIAVGVICTSLPSISPAKIMSGGGVVTAITSGIAFAFYLIFMQLGFKKLHPIPVSLVQFFTIFILSSLILISPLNLGVHVDQPSGFLGGGVILGVLTLVGYLANNFGVRFMGAARASIVASSGPVVTALLAFLLIKSPLQWVQILGIFLVTAGVTALSFERMKGQPAAPKAK